MMRRFLPAALPLILLTACSKPPEAPAAPSPANPAAQAPAGPAAAMPVADGDLTKGEHVYKATCSMCHASGAAGAPTLKSNADWGPRIAQGKPVLYAHALGGFNGSKGSMPARGGNPSLSDKDVKAAVDYMVANTQ